MPEIAFAAAATVVVPSLSRDELPPSEGLELATMRMSGVNPWTSDPCCTGSAELLSASAHLAEGKAADTTGAPS